MPTNEVIRKLLTRYPSSSHPMHWACRVALGEVLPTGEGSRDDARLACADEIAATRGSRP